MPVGSKEGTQKVMAALARARANIIPPTKDLVNTYFQNAKYVSRTDRQVSVLVRNHKAPPEELPFQIRSERQISKTNALKVSC